MSTTRRTAGVHSRKRPLGPNGEKICYNCGGPLPKGKPFNCSKKCSVEWQCKTSTAYLRSTLFNRDRGVCALCRVDTEALKKQYHAIREPHPEFPTLTRPDESAKTAFLELHEIPYGRVNSDWWDADHITPVIEGGGECGLDNLRTLCIPCHARVTRELARRRAEKRKVEKIEQRDNERGLLADL